MVLDRLEGGSVDGLWREQGKLAEDHAAHIILQVVSAVRYCHDRGIAVRGERSREANVLLVGTADCYRLLYKCSWLVERSVCCQYGTDLGQTETSCDHVQASHSTACNGGGLSVLDTQDPTFPHVFMYVRWCP